MTSKILDAVIVVLVVAFGFAISLVAGLWVIIALLTGFRIGLGVASDIFTDRNVFTGKTTTSEG